MFGDAKVIVFHVDFEEFDLFVSRTCGKVFIIGRYLHFEDVVVVHFDGFLVLFCHVLPIQIDKSFVVSKSHAL